MPRYVARDLAIEAEGPVLGPFSGTLPLNRAFRPGHARLRLRLRIDWRPASPVEEFRRLHERLVSVSPGLAGHACRGLHRYRIAAAAAGAAGNGDPAGGPFETDLALAHLIEHLIIDTVAFVTSSRRVSGITGAPLDRTEPLDLFVECPDLLTARLASRMALSLLVSTRNGAFDPDTGRTALLLVRHLYRAWPGAIHPRAAARALRQDAETARQALEWLVNRGIACPIPFTMALDGDCHYGFCPEGPGAEA